MEQNVPAKYAVAGQITNERNEPLAGRTVQVFDRDPERGEQPVGPAAASDAEGRYTIAFTSLDLAPGRAEPDGPELFVRVYDSEQANTRTSEGAIGESGPARARKRRVTLNVVVADHAEEPKDAPKDDPNDPWLRVYGVVRDQYGDLLTDVVVEAFDRDLRSEQSLGSSPARKGQYEIRYRRSQFNKAEKDSADLLMRVAGSDGKQLYESPIHYNAPDDLEWDLSLSGAAYEGASEWDVLTDALTPLLEDVAPKDLQENDQHQDISFLAGETDNSRLAIGRWIACFMLADKSELEQVALPAEAFFAFLRQGQPSIFSDSLVEDMQHPDRVVLLEDKILRALAELTADLQATLLKQAIAERLIPARVEPQFAEILATLQRIKLRYAADDTFGGGKGTIAELLQLTPAAKEEQTAFMAAFTAHTGPLNTFWKTLEDDQVLKPEVVQQLKLSFELGALSRNHIPLVGELLNEFKQGALTNTRELAKYDRAAWMAVFERPGPDGKPIGVPANIDGVTDAVKQEQFAAILEQQFERAFPTASFTGKLERAEQTPLRAKPDLVRFLNNNPVFQLDRYRAEHYIAEHDDALQDIEDKAALLTDLKSVQRVFKLNPTYPVVDALLTRKIDSAQQIYFMGQGQLSTALADTGINKIELRQLYRKAENAYAYALTLYGDYNLALNGVAPFVVPSQTLDATTQTKLAVLPNLQTLFGSLDYCECRDCRSVYSPAAYFVDVMRFLGERGTQGATINAGKNVRQVLLERRPDLGEIELSCENTNTPLPYIDLVNEILEDVVAPPTPVTLSSAIEVDLVAGPIKPSVLSDLTSKAIAIAADADVYDPDIRGRWVIRDSEHAYEVFKTGATLRLLPTRQSFLSAAELRANPEYTNQAAYAKLKGEVFPLNLPFDLANDQTRRYLEHLGVPHPRLLELFQQKLTDDVTLAPTALQIDCAWLAITDTERQIVTGALPSKQPWDFWGLAETGNAIPNPDNPADPTENLTGTWIDVLGHVDVMLNRSSLAYTELLQLIDMQYVNADGGIFIFDTADPNAASCDTSKFMIRNLSADALNRIQRFIRLWRKLGCEMWELDLLLPDMDPAPNVVDKRITDDALQDISRLNRLRTETGLDWRVLNSLYRGIDHQPYLDRSQEGAPAVQTLYERLFRNKLVDAVASFPASPEQITGTIADSVPGILAAFRIKETDLDLILADLGLLATANLDATVLGHIYRITALAQALGLKVDAFLRLKRLWAQDPFANPAKTLEFVQLDQWVADSEFSVLELDYLLAHRYTPNSGIALEDKAIVTVLQAIRDGLQKIANDVSRKPEETNEAYVRSKLGRLPALTKDADQVVALSIIDGTWQGTQADRDTLIIALFADVLDPTVAETKLGPIAGGLTPAAHQEEVDKRFDYVQPELERFLLQTSKEAFIREKIAEILQLDVPSAGALLTGLHLAAATANLLATINDDRLLARQADGSYQFTPDETNFPAIFQTLRLLHKDALIVGKLQITATELTWWLAGTNAAEMGWMHPADFPIDTTTQLEIGKWVAIQLFFAWTAALPKSDLTAIEFATNVLDNAKSSSSNLGDLAQLTASDVDDLTALATAFHWLDQPAAFDVIKQQLRQASNLVRVADCLTALRRLGVNAERAIGWATADPGASDADSLKQTIKAKYDLPQWLQVIEPLQDDFREQKREALVSWLVTHPDQTQGQNWSDPDGLYNYFLIDVEMSACMLSSRLKQAAASAQLFVQRCLLNLEVDILAKTDLDSKWKQWKWMKRYRVWEANRKVFLYPENWLEPELRDEKSPFFKELESELQQNDITNDTAEQAYLNYLEKLDKVANLEIRALFNQTISQDESLLHVFARSRSSQAPEYHYRQRINRGRWTAWEKVDLDINANHLVAGIHNRRLYLLWPQFLDKADDPPASIATPAASSSAPLVPPTKYWEIRLFWSELKKGRWTPKVLSDSFAQQYQSQAGGDRRENLDFRTRLAPNVQVRLYSSRAPSSEAPTSLVFFDKLGKQISEQPASVYEHIISPAESQYRNNLIAHNSASQYFYYSSVEETGKPHTLAAHENAAAIRLLQNARPGSTYSVIDSQAKAFLGDGSFFVWDPAHTYFVDYSWRTDYSYWSRAWHARTTSNFAFFIHYHPFVELFIKELNIWGIKGLLNRQIQVSPATIPGSSAPFNFADYQPDGANVVQPWPQENVDFSYFGAYSPYNWELFFHVPFFIANKLSANQRFEEALDWYHYIFDPTSTDTATPDPDTPQQKYWITKPFYETTKADYYKQKIENIMLAIAKGDAELRQQVSEWRDNPFKPHLIARMRTVAYQKNVLIKYIRTLIAWGDQLFRQDTIETLNEATQLYVLAASILGPRPKSIPRSLPNPIKTFYQLQQEGIDDFGNALKEVENLLPPAPASNGAGPDGPELPHIDVLYFCIPNNENLLTLWDTVSDRLFKIRHCMNIEGVVRQLPLFEPPIDPGLLVKAAAAGLDIGAALNDMNAPLPLYRFSFMVQRAIELCNEVKTLGAAMLSALERRDAEAFALLRSSHEQTMLAQIRIIRDKQVEEALHLKEALDESRKVVDERRQYHDQLVRNGLNAWEIASLAMSGGAVIAEVVATVLNAIGSGTSLIPEVNAGASGFGGTPHLTLSLGGKSVTSGLSKAADVSRGIASSLQMGAGMAATIGNHNRRADDWRHLQRLAEKELPQIDKQILAADIRHQIAIQDLANQDKQSENAQSEDEYLRSKFTSQELYDWMISQLSIVYFQSYELAYDLAKRAERCFRYELGLADSSYIQFGYWDSLKKGLLSAERLTYDLRRLEAAYYEQNRREYELRKHISLAQLDPVALLKLRENGECFVDIPETAFDMDYPGHYFRRLKTVGLSIPCTVGPYTTVACTLTLVSNHLRKDSTLLASKYARDTTIEDQRFRDEVGAIQSIATSGAQNDDGMFELNFRDERYLPFEGAGAISSWHIKLNKELPQFDFDTISDVIIHVSYTAREGGELLASKAVEEFSKKMNDLALAESRRGLFHLFDIKREYPDKWYRFLHPANPADDQAIVLDDLADRLPYFTHDFTTKKVRQIELVAQMKDAATYKVLLSPLGETPADLLSLAPDTTYDALHRALKDLTGSEIDFSAWTLKLQADGAADFKSLPADAISEMLLILNYTVA
jgi:hypothetical protein